MGEWACGWDCGGVLGCGVVEVASVKGLGLLQWWVGGDRIVRFGMGGNLL